MAGLTAGISEVIPVSEYIADFGAAKIAEKITGRELRSTPIWMARVLNWIPFVGDFASATFFDGLIDIASGSYELAKNKMQDN